MQSNISSKWSLLLIISIVGIIFSSIIIFFPDLHLTNWISLYAKPASLVSSQAPQNLIVNETAESAQVSPSAIPKQGQANPGLPIRLKIPAINIDSPVEYVGLTPSGTMDISKNPDNVAWFKPGPRPGEKGSAVIAGHFGWENNIPAAFDNLYKLRQGDKLYIEDDKGSTISFVVRESRSFNPESDSSSVFVSNNGKSYLNLITCEGIWDKISKSYSKRLVIFTDKE